MERVSLNVKAHRRLGEKRLVSSEFFSPEFEELGQKSWAEHKTTARPRRRRSGAEQAAGRDAGPAEAGGAVVSAIIADLIGRLELGEPASDGGLTLIPVFGGFERRPEFVTLEEAIARPAPWWSRRCPRAAPYPCSRRTTAAR